MDKQFFDRPEFTCLGKEKIVLIEELAEKGKGKSPMELMGLFKQYESKLSGGGVISPEEKKAMFLVIRENMNDEEKKRMDKMLSILGMMG